MDAVQAKHLRTFANAIAWALQTKPDTTTAAETHLKGLLGKLEKSVSASAFLDASPILPAVKNSRANAVVTPAVVASKAAVTTAQSTALAGQFFNRVPWAGKAPTTEPVQKIAEQPANHAPHEQTKAVDFFASLSWGKSAAKSLSIGTSSDDPQRSAALVTRLGQSERPSLLTNALHAQTSSAAGFFARVPWRGQATAP